MSTGLRVVLSRRIIIICYRYITFRAIIPSIGKLVQMPHSCIILRLWYRTKMISSCYTFSAIFHVNIIIIIIILVVHITYIYVCWNSFTFKKKKNLKANRLHKTLSDCTRNSLGFHACNKSTAVRALISNDTYIMITPAHLIVYNESDTILN